ncbi:hypothetical protein BGZ63DRAFT_360224, partial [Mariannaea sp. PMI_226]
ASKLKWDDDILIKIFYKGLKDSIKNEIYKTNKPNTLIKFIIIVIKIDKYKYKRYKERAKEKRKGKHTDYNLYYPKYSQGHQNNQYNQRPANRNTSYRSHAGPIELGNVQKDILKVRCYNYSKHGYMAYICPKPKKDKKF